MNKVFVEHLTINSYHISTRWILFVFCISTCRKHIVKFLMTLRSIVLIFFKIARIVNLLFYRRESSSSIRQIDTWRQNTQGEWWIPSKLDTKCFSVFFQENSTHYTIDKISFLFFISGNSQISLHGCVFYLMIKLIMSKATELYLLMPLFIFRVFEIFMQTELYVFVKDDD